MNRYSTDFWKSQVEIVEKDYTNNGVTSTFLKHPVLMQTMVATGYDEWTLEMARRAVSVFGFERVKELLAEEPEFGGPMTKTISMKEGDLVGSHNNVQHLAHIAKFKEVVGDYEPNSVIEWGGGYGNFARLMMSVYPSIERYVIFDLPIFNTIQQVYLSEAEAYGVELINSDDADKFEGKCDMFVSTWALSECVNGAVDLVKDRKMWGAQHFLLAEQPPNSMFEAAGTLQNMIWDLGFDKTSEVVPFRENAKDIYILG